MNTGTFTFEEMNLICIYNTGSRADLMNNLREMRGHLEEDETELLTMTDSALEKLSAMSDDEFSQLDLIPDFDL